MKNYLLLLLIPILFACDKENFNNENPYITNYSFSADVNMNLPLYNNLRFAGNSVYVSNIGALGVWVFNSGSGFFAYDAACPNQPIAQCSTMIVSAGYATCQCDEIQYSMYTGLGEGDVQYPMKQYRVQVNGDVLRIYN